MKRVFLFLFLGLFFISFASAKAAPMMNVGEIGFQIFYPAYEYVKVNSDFELNIHVANLTDGLEINNTALDCYLHLYNTNGTHLLEAKMQPDSNRWDWVFLIKGGNFSELGEHAFRIFCIDGVGGTAGGTFVVTKTGEVLSSEDTTLYGISLISLFLMSLCLITCTFFLPSKDETDEEGTILKISLLKHLRPMFLIFAWGLIMACVFIIGNFSLMYLSSDMLGDIFMKLFIMMFAITLVGLPLWLIKIFTDIFRDKEVKRMLERGVDINTP